MDKKIDEKKLKEELIALADLAIDCYKDFKKRGLIDARGNLIKTAKGD